MSENSGRVAWERKWNEKEPGKVASSFGISLMAKSHKSEATPSNNEAIVRIISDQFLKCFTYGEWHWCEDDIFDSVHHHDTPIFPPEAAVNGLLRATINGISSLDVDKIPSFEKAYLFVLAFVYYHGDDMKRIPACMESQKFPPLHLRTRFLGTKLQKYPPDLKPPEHPLLQRCG
ncbi:hypothetical protein E5288_WYG002064 [Bos mutus]|uniref:Uncharacterized protein n=1 Tax=Bos mutus TaxID=72004 RepID=A0A6B0RDV8_9CETA|nr:hypothetical protein [Bos mutus]